MTPLFFAALLALPAHAAPKPKKTAPPQKAPVERAAEPEEDPVARGVVKIFTTARHPDYYQPWQMASEESWTGSGVLIKGGRILTNAHVVADAVFIQVRKAGDARMYPARVEFIANDGELAALRVDNPSFYKDMRPLELGALPARRDRVEAYGFPEGGDDLSVTDGVVSRVEVTEYVHSGREMLTIQTDAAINPGNSGGPMVKDGKLVGVNFQLDPEAQSVGYAIPAPLISRFLDDIADGTYKGVPDIGIRWEPAENRAKREWAGLSEDQTGIRVSSIVYDSSAWGRLQPGDMISSIDGVAVADDGTVPLRRGERVLFSHLIDKRQIGDAAKLGVVRAGKPLELTVPLKAPRSLVEPPNYGGAPSYFVYGGLVFTPLTRDYIDGWDYDDVPVELKYFVELALPTPQREQLIVLSHVLPDAVNAGYHDFRGVPIKSINGRPIGRMRDVIEAFKHPAGRFDVIETDAAGAPSEVVVLDAAEAERASASIIQRYGIPADRSPDLVKQGQ